MLQRDVIDVSGSNGLLTVGRLPDGISNSSLTWVPVRLYRPEDGGLHPPQFAPNEVCLSSLDGLWTFVNHHPQGLSLVSQI